MNTDMTYAKAIANADALKSIGQTKVHLFSGKDFPWHIATGCEAGSSFRLNIATSVNFHGEQDGLTFTWYFDIEKRESNGTGTTKLDIEGCKDVLKKLSGPVLVAFRTYLSDCAAAVKRQGDEYQVVADRQYRDAAILRDLVNHP